MGLPDDEAFWVPDGVLEQYRESGRRGAEARSAWEERLASFAGDRAGWDAAQAGGGVDGWEDQLPTWDAGGGVATRKASNACLQALLDVVPGLIGGGADL